MKYLITGGCGFLGSNIASEILKQGNELVVFDSLYRFGSYQNLEWLRTQGEFEFVHGDIRNTNDVERTIKTHKPDVIYHLAGQVAMTTSILDPRMDFEVNVGGSFNLLNAVRLYSPESTIIYSSTNKVYGDLEQFTYKETETRYRCIEKPNGFDESVNLDFHSPYGTSKGSADQYMLDFARIYGLKTVVFRHSSMFGGRQFATYDQGWIGWFTQQSINIKNKTLKEPFTISGNGKQVRDIAHAEDMVALYLKASTKIDSIKGQAFNVGGGIENSSSLLELFHFLENELDVKMEYTQLPVRESDQKIFVADLTKAKELIGWEPKISKEEGIRKMIEWVSGQ
ncbi:MAG: CDP-paratose 2-epimerase [Sulfuricurvum sp. GWF2_44_89]|uniref:NAD-dependent epimerase/dehydratase family protein n=1 Tax=unclassified Sulfuricurvum TaxID=2632390 RepID=UPI0008C80EF1|nr:MULTISPECIES: NAD-dependent epimerase/dehydratase family protein [unclassified Sulfuricurvum]OHD78129.1 MAG: CDP-paratose 2-epimerase [Sulfuricurvum sp. GWF2_44_89]OHD91463.1 MAG: CDP-paratose 2-epimerase [Sulfuricurvum sp. RIFOXYD12_FULL_44_77]OHD92594.1 MAG: CDP-paratose 2-epimerase [Sulfuricurvum sp. RIFOXYD2_FULL_44_160]